MTVPARAVLTDLGGVLTSSMTEGLKQLQGTIVAQGYGAMRIIAERDEREILAELERGDLTEREFFDALAAELHGAPDFSDFGRTYFAALAPNERMVQFVRELHDRGIRLALLTNSVREWEPYWRALLPDADAIFDAVISSANVGTRKPEPRFYELALERLGPDLQPAECVFVDDVEGNCAAARTLGFHTVHFASTDQAIAEIDAAIAS